MKLGVIHWALIGLVTAGLVVMAPSDNEGDSASQARPVKHGSGKAATTAASADKPRSQAKIEVGHVELDRLAKFVAKQAQETEVGDAFNSTTWYVAPPPPPYVAPPPPPPPPPPTAPPLPFTYMGRYNEAESWIIILAKGDRVYTVAEGDVIENTYRVEKLTAGKINLTYLPLNIAQSLRTGDTL
jgi:hypothetical protein